MKPIRLSFAALLIAACATMSNAQGIIPANTGYSEFAELKDYEELNVLRYGNNFLGSLEYASCNPIVESGLAQIAMLKLAQPKAPLETLKKKIDELTLHGGTPAIRYKAYLTGMVFEHPELFVYEKYGTYVDGEAFFSALGRRLQKEALAVQ